MAKTQKIAGFSLIELSVVLTIVGVIIGAGLAISTENAEIARNKDTRARMEFIMRAIDNYVDNQTVLGNAHIPCPANPQALFSATDFGIGSTSVTPSCDSSNVTTTGNVAVGAVPVYTLNIPPTFILDGWNRRFYYSVDVQTIDGASYSSGGRLIVNNYAGTQYSNEAAVVLVSGGSNGLGTWGGRGGTAKLSDTGETTEEAENNDDDDTFVQGLNLGDLDDIVMYKTIWQLDGTE